ncbi:MAG: signal recognition particle protein [Pseudomonadota bacterium]
MFANLTDRLDETLQKIRGQGRLSDDNIRETVRDVRMALLEADVALPVVKAFTQQIREKAAGTEIMQSLSPGETLVKIVKDELTVLMGEQNESLNLSAQPPAVIMLAGLQGSGKTTSAAKLARFLLGSGKKVMLVSCDVYRPAAIQQLAVLANDIGALLHPSDAAQKPTEIATAALDAAKRSFADVLIVDTAGRLHVDTDMMTEVQALHAVVDPVETLFVVDAMTGQDAAITAQAFDQSLPLTGVILTKADGDARGGAALSIRQVTGKPIKFLGTGENTTALEPFYPDRVASRILGMGDVLSLVEEVQQKVDQRKAKKLARKIQKGQGFSLADFRDQLQEIQGMGGAGSMLDKLPGMNQVPDKVKQQFDTVQTNRMVAIINSMTPHEREFFKVIKGSRKKRIAAGSGTQVQDINKLLKQFQSTQKMMKKFSGGGMEKMMRKFQGAF